jgi:tetratricopeptide (TPR) repeat protein
VFARQVGVSSEASNKIVLLEEQVGWSTTGAVADMEVKRQTSKIREVDRVGHSVNNSYKSRSSSDDMNFRCLRNAFLVIAALIGMLTSAALAQQTHLQHSAGVSIQGSVLDLAGKSVANVSVRLEQKGALKPLETTTNAAGVFSFSALPTGRYLLSAKKSGLSSHGTAVLALSEGDRKNIDLVLEVLGDLQSNSSASSPPSSQAMEFTDKPSFAIAGVVDWTAVGGHGSDFALRTSEDLTRKTLTLKPEDLSYSGSGVPSSASEGNESENELLAALAGAPGSFDGNHQLGEFYFHTGRYRDSVPLLQGAYQIDPTMDGNAYDLALAFKEVGAFSQAREVVQKLLTHKNTADLHSLAGELDEKLGDPLAAVQEEERAVRLDPSEQNYFAWGSELLLHRAVWQAVEVLRDGEKTYPKSSRMLTALGTALFAGALYDEAALRLCDASDLNPANPEPYIFMGKIEMAAPTALPCVEQKLARLVQQQPENPLANYLYAMAVWKRQERTADQRDLQQVETLLTKAVTVDPNCVDAYLQLGILYSSQRNYEKAIGFYSKAIEVNPQLGEAHYRLGVAYDRTGKPAKANREFLLHDEIEKQQAAAAEHQREEVKQFLVVLPWQPTRP